MAQITIHSKKKSLSEFQKHPSRHPAFKTLNKYDLLTCSNMLGCSLNHLRNVLYGHCTCSNKLHTDIMSLQEQLESLKEVAANG